MKPTLSLLLSPLSSLAARLRRARPGSVLIIVIVLLLLLAILGTAFLSTTRTDRVASQQNVLNADVDSTLNGIAKICEGTLVDDLNDTFGNLRGNTAYTNNTTIVNRSFFQGEGQGMAGAPPIAPNVANYNIGDVVNTTDTPNLFYYYNNGTSGTTVGAVTAVTPVTPNPNGTPSNGWQVMNGHLPITAVGSDPWLADRIPDPDGSIKAAIWRNLSQSIQVNAAYPTGAAMSIIGTDFEDPTYNSPGSFTPARNPSVTTGTIITSYLNRPLLGGTAATPTPLIPTFITSPNGFNIPALTYANPNPNQPGTTFVAGDADGDGIADCFLFRIPGLALDGLTWYAGVRIIDNNSAINANTAWSRDTESYYAPNTGANTSNIWALFPTGVGLTELINASDSINTLNQYRFNQPGVAAPTAGQDPLDESAINNNVPPISFDRTAGTKDYSFISQSEALYQQFIRRMANPGYDTAGVRYQALPYSDATSLAYHFCLINPEVTLSGVPSSVTENNFPFSLYLWTKGPPATYYRSTPYGSNPSTDATTWFNDNFNYATPASSSYGVQPIRPLLVPRNPVSNYIQQVYNNNNGNSPNVSSYAQPTTQPSISDPILPNYMLPYSGSTNPHFKGVWSDLATYGMNDIVVYPGTPGTTNYTFISVNALNSAQKPATFTNGVVSAVTTAYWQLQPWSINPTKTNINTATFRELFRAFWCVMAGNPSNATPFGYTADPVSIYDDSAANPQHQFRSPLRDPTNAVPGASGASELDGPAATQPSTIATNTNTMLLRAGIAAVNGMGLRDNSQNITSKTFILKNAWVLGGNGGGGGVAPADVEVRVYSGAPQPFISEVYVNTNTQPDPASPTPNPGGYVAVELFNPYPVSLTMINWTLAYINRQTLANGGTYPNLQFNTIGTIGATAPVVIAPHGYLLLENCNYTGAPPATQPDADAATYRPTDSGIQPTLGTVGPWTGPATPSATTQPSTQPSSYQEVYVPFLENVIKGATLVPLGQTTPTQGGELVLLRPRRADGILTTYTDPANPNAAGSESFNENNACDLVPVDSYDFTNLTQGSTTNYTVWSYIRPKGDDPAGAGNYLFRATYPGKYDATAAGPRETTTYAQPGIPVGTEPTYPGGSPTTQPSNPPSTQPSAPAFGLAAPGNPSIAPFPPVQIYNVGGTGLGFSSHFPNFTVASNVTVSGATVTIAPGNGAGTQYGTPPYFYPSGGFARNGDMLDIPCIGAYRIRVLDSTDTVSLYGATSFLEINPVTKDCASAAVEDATETFQNIGRFMPIAAHAPGYTGTDYYAWARNIFNYLTVQSSTDAYLPNFDPNLLSSDNTAAPSFAYPGQNATPPAPMTASVPPTPALTADATAIDPTRQDNVGVEGLVNINTASWKVLSMLPLVPGNAAATQTLAQAIVTYRLAHGPFMSIFDLNQVPGFQTAEGAIAVNAPSSALGLMSPADPGFGTASPNPSSPLGAEEDYQGDCLELTRISNLITTRSDTFTVYIVLQGWQNVGSTNPNQPPSPMVTRRYAFIVDRSAINADPTSRYVKTLVVPNN